MLDSIPWKTLMVLVISLTMISKLPRTPVEPHQSHDPVQIIHSTNTVEPVKIEGPFKLEVPKFNFKLGTSSQNNAHQKEDTSFFPKKYYPRN